jgi:hypothetical protein
MRVLSARTVLSVCARVPAPKPLDLDTVQKAIVLLIACFDSFKASLRKVKTQAKGHKPSRKRASSVTRNARSITDLSLLYPKGYMF